MSTVPCRFAAIWLAALVAVAGVMTASSRVTAQAPALEITQDQNGATLHATVGQQVTIRLGTGLEWTVSYDPPGILVAVPGVNALVRGVQGILRAKKPGTVQISGQGRPQCQAGQACAQFIEAFHATVIVDAAPAAATPSSPPSGPTAGTPRVSTPAATQKPATPPTTAPTAKPPAAPAPRPTHVALPNTGAGPARTSAPAHAGWLLAAIGLSAALGALALFARRNHHRAR